MFIFKPANLILLAALAALPAWAAADSPAEPSTTMPMMHQGGAGMMTPEMMMQMMPGQMPMMHQQMMPMMGQMGPWPGHFQGQSGAPYGMPMMGGMGMPPQMMQMHMQHMYTIEQRLQKIEGLLQQLVEQGKSG